MPHFCCAAGGAGGSIVADRSDVGADVARCVWRTVRNPCGVQMRDLLLQVRAVFMFKGLLPPAPHALLMLLRMPQGAARSTSAACATCC